jgi:hypothetical protein
MTIARFCPVDQLGGGTVGGIVRVYLNHRSPSSPCPLALLDRVLRETVQRRNLVQPQERVRLVAEQARTATKWWLSIGRFGTANRAWLKERPS